MKLPILYKRSNSKNHINQWEIEIEGNKFRTTTGFVDMKMFTGDWTECLGKNQGKKNSTTNEEQALAEAQAKWQKRKDLGYFEDINNCDNKLFFSPMLAHEFTKEKKRIDYNEDIFSDPKLDGVRCIIKSDGMWSRNGKQIISAPHIYESLKYLFDEDEDLILDGELYADKSVIDFNTIISCVRKIKPTQEDLNLSAEYIEFWIYDCPSHDGLFSERKEYLYKLILPGTCELVFSTKCSSENELTELYRSYIQLGFEGQMIRTNSYYENKRSKSLIKRKEFFDEEYIIQGINEGTGKFAGKAATMNFVTEGGVVFKATINGTMDYLESLLKIKDELIGKSATVKYFEKTTDGSIRFGKVINIAREDFE